MKSASAAIGYLLAGIFFILWLMAKLDCRSSSRLTVRDSVVVSRHLIFDTVHYSFIHTVIKEKEASVIPIPVSIDTAAIIRDYFTKRSYQLSENDSLHESRFSIGISKNNLDSFRHEIRYLRPVQVVEEKHFPVIKPKRFMAFVSGGVDTYSWFSVGGGFKIDHTAIGYHYHPLTQIHQVTVSRDLFGF